MTYKGTGTADLAGLTVIHLRWRGSLEHLWSSCCPSSPPRPCPHTGGRGLSLVDVLLNHLLLLRRVGGHLSGGGRRLRKLRRLLEEAAWRRAVAGLGVARVGDRGEGGGSNGESGGGTGHRRLVANAGHLRDCGGCRVMRLLLAIGLLSGLVWLVARVVGLLDGRDWGGWGGRGCRRQSRRGLLAVVGLVGAWRGVKGQRVLLSRRLTNQAEGEVVPALVASVGPDSWWEWRSQLAGVGRACEAGHMSQVGHCSQLDHSHSSGTDHSHSRTAEPLLHRTDNTWEQHLPYSL